MTIRPILGVFAIAGTTVLLTGCEPLENALAVMNNGQPMPGSPSQVSYYVSPVASVPVVEVALEDVPEPQEPCVILATEFRQWMCSEDGRKILIP
jgi:hypothetical protein